MRGDTLRRWNVGKFGTLGAGHEKVGLNRGPKRRNRERHASRKKAYTAL